MINNRRIKETSLIEAFFFFLIAEWLSLRHFEDKILEMQIDGVI